jgi:hypothetical protein
MYRVLFLSNNYCFSLSAVAPPRKCGHLVEWDKRDVRKWQLISIRSNDVSVFYPPGPSFLFSLFLSLIFILNQTSQVSGYHSCFVIGQVSCWLRGILLVGFVVLLQYRDSLRAGRSRDRTLVVRECPHPSSLALGATHHPVQWTPCFLPLDKTVGVWCWPHNPSSAGVKERIELHFYSPSGPLWPVLSWNLPYLYLSPSRQFCDINTN